MTDTPREAARPEAARIRDDIQETRQKLGDTVDALARKADVSGRVKQKATEALDTTKAKAAVAKQTVTAKADQAVHAAQVKAADVTAQAQQTVDKLPEPVARRASGILAGIRQRPGMFLAGMIVTIAVLRRVAMRKRTD